MSQRDAIRDHAGRGRRGPRLLRGGSRLHRRSASSSARPRAFFQLTQRKLAEKGSCVGSVGRGSGSVRRWIRALAAFWAARAGQRRRRRGRRPDGFGICAADPARRYRHGRARPVLPHPHRRSHPPHGPCRRDSIFMVCGGSNPSPTPQTHEERGWRAAVAFAGGPIRPDGLLSMVKSDWAWHARRAR